MVKPINSKRVFFPKGKQNKLINKILLKISIKKAANLCNLSERTIRDWRREKFSISFIALRKLCQKTNIPLPSSIKLKDRYWYVKHGASKGGKAVWKKYGTIGDPEYRKKKWHEWWAKEGKYKYNFIGKTKSIKKPSYSKNLAEFVGIILGDGSITQYQITFTLHSKDDKKYGNFIINLTKKLFDTPIGIHYYKRCKATSYAISRKELVSFCTKEIGLKIGNKVKQQVDVPSWIKQNKQYSIACMRGLIDTDGSIFNHNYKVSDKLYSYKKLSFTNLSKPLVIFVYKTMKNIGLNPRISRKIDVCLDSIKDMQTYFKIVNSHNQKHLNRYLK